MLNGARYRLFRMWEKHRLELRALVTGEFPDWLLSLEAAAPAEVPAFVFHEADLEVLEAALRFLADGGYRTLTADEMADLGGRNPDGERLVLLAFDDSLASVRAIAYPLLEEYGFRAVVFAVPAVIGHGTEVWPDLTDLRAGRATPRDLQERQRRQPFCTWAEMAEMAGSGVIDVQSHSLSHHRIAVSERVLDFVHPGLDLWYGNFDLPVAAPDKGVERVPEPGVPLYVSASRLSGQSAFIEPAGLTPALVDLVASRGGEAFFSSPGWRRELRRTVRRHLAANPGRHESAAETRAAMRREISAGRRALEERLPGHRIRHLAYPWMLGGPVADELAIEAGMRSVYYGPSFPAPTAPGLLRIRRLPESYMMRLPGRRRASFAGLLRQRVSRALSR